MSESILPSVGKFGASRGISLSRSSTSPSQPDILEGRKGKGESISYIPLGGKGFCFLDKESCIQYLNKAHVYKPDELKNTQLISCLERLLDPALGCASRAAHGAVNSLAIKSLFSIVESEELELELEGLNINGQSYRVWISSEPVCLNIQVQASSVVENEGLLCINLDSAAVSINGEAHSGLSIPGYWQCVVSALIDQRLQGELKGEAANPEKEIVEEGHSSKKTGSRLNEERFNKMRLIKQKLERLPALQQTLSIAHEGFYVVALGALGAKPRDRSVRVTVFRESDIQSSLKGKKNQISGGSAQIVKIQDISKQIHLLAKVPHSKSKSKKEGMWREIEFYRLFESHGLTQHILSSTHVCSFNSPPRVIGLLLGYEEGTLLDLVRGKELKKTPIKTRIQWLLPVLGFIEDAANLGLWHRDLHSGNVFYSLDDEQNPRCLVGDFDLMLRADESPPVLKGKVGRIPGTVHLVIPSSFDISEPKNRVRADLCQFAILILELLTGSLLQPGLITDRDHKISLTEVNKIIPEDTPENIQELLKQLLDISVEVDITDIRRRIQELT